MRGSKPILAGLLGLTAIAACGLPPATRGGAPVTASGPHDPARRFEVLNAVPVCTPTPAPNGTATPGNCTAIGARDGTYLMLLVDRTPFDIGEVNFQVGDVLFVAFNPSVVLGTNGLGNQEATIGANFSGIWMGAPEDEPDAIDPVFITFTLDLVNGFYTADSEDSQYDGSGQMSIVLVRPNQCTLIPGSELFPN